jgi:DeoR/GlpR family transcriptional regulator of sugar metabolism
VSLLLTRWQPSLVADYVGPIQRQEQEIVQTKRAMIASAKRRVPLVAHNKLGKVALHRHAPLRDFVLVVVDAGVYEAKLAELREGAISTEIAPR